MSKKNTHLKAKIQTASEIEKARNVLGNLDPVLAAIHEVIPIFEWRVQQCGFIGLAKIIVGQQVSVASATAIWKRFEEGIGEVTSYNVLKFSIDKLRTFGLSKQKADYIHAIAQSEIDGAIDFEELRKLDDEAAIAKLDALKGVGKWTAEIYLMFCEGRVDLFPAGDLALQEGLRLADHSAQRLSEKALYARAELWRPYRGVAAHMLWAYYSTVKRGEIASLNKLKDGVTFTESSNTESSKKLSKK